MLTVVLCCGACIVIVWIISYYSHKTVEKGLNKFKKGSKEGNDSKEEVVEPTKSSDQKPDKTPEPTVS